MAVIVGGALLVIAALLVRFREPLAKWQIDTRVETIRRVNMQNADYQQRQIDSLRTPGSLRLTRLLVVALAVLLAGVGLYAIVRGVGFGA